MDTAPTTAHLGEITGQKSATPEHDDPGTACAHKTTALGARLPPEDTLSYHHPLTAYARTWVAGEGEVPLVLLWFKISLAGFSCQRPRFLFLQMKNCYFQILFLF